MKDNWNQERNLVYYLLAFIDSNKENDKNNALLWLNKIADYYNVNLKKKAVKMTLYDALMMFLKNDKGMDENLNRIYSILKQS